MSMTLQEAASLLEIDLQNASDDDINKAFKKKGIKYHPDVNKDPNAESEFKKYNEAKDILLKRNEPQKIGGNPFSNGYVDISDIFAGFQGFQRPKKRKQVVIQDVVSSVKITFVESILGTSKEIQYTRNIPCQACEGEGASYSMKGGCAPCGGKGYTETNSSKNKNSYFSQRIVCHACEGKGKEIEEKKCENCKGSGTESNKTKGSVNIPAGIKSGMQLRVQGAGNFIPDMGFTNLMLTVYVEPAINMELVDHDVVSKISLTFKEAILGCKKTVPTIDGLKEIDIPELSKHKDVIVLPNLGVNRQWNQLVNLSVEYPENIKDLIK